MQLQPIIVFDSGIGGLSIYRPLKHALPEENILYLSDPVGFPYGNKSEVWLTDRFRALTPQIKALNPKLLVLACNTATTTNIASLRAELNCPVVGVEPVIKPLSKYDSALALMTTTSAQAKNTQQLLLQWGTKVKVFTPTKLAQAIEYNDIKQVKSSIHEIKKVVQKYHIQAVGLSCTHYPLILNELQSAMPGVIFVDPSEAVVSQVIRVLESSKV